MDPEFLQALELVAEYDRQRPKFIKEYRLYYNSNGEVTGYCEVDHPSDTNYIVLENPDQYFKNNTAMMRVVNGKLEILSTQDPIHYPMVKSDSGQPVVAGMATVALMHNETYQNIEYYVRSKNY